MLNNREIERLLDAMRASQVTALDAKNKAHRLRLILPATVAPSTQSALPIAQMEAISDVVQLSANSPSIGTFLRRGIDDGLPLLKAGMHITEREVLGYVCLGPVRVIVDAPANGVLLDGGPDDGAVLGLGDAVFNLEVTYEN